MNKKVKIYVTVFLLVCFCACSSLKMVKDSVSLLEIKELITELESKPEKTTSDEKSILILKRAEKSLIEKDEQIFELEKEIKSDIFTKTIGKYVLIIFSVVVVSFLAWVVFKIYFRR